MTVTGLSYAARGAGLSPVASGNFVQRRRELALPRNRRGVKEPASCSYAMALHVVGLGDRVCNMLYRVASPPVITPISFKLRKTLGRYYYWRHYRSGQVRWIGLLAARLSRIPLGQFTDECLSESRGDGPNMFGPAREWWRCGVIGLAP